MCRDSGRSRCARAPQQEFPSIYSAAGGVDDPLLEQPHRRDGPFNGILFYFSIFCVLKNYLNFFRKLLSHLGSYLRYKKGCMLGNKSLFNSILIIYFMFNY
jgi:hypothetical protein